MRLIFPWSVRTSGGVGRPWMRERWRNHRDRRGGFSCLQGAALSCNPRSCREWRVGVHWTHGNTVVNHTFVCFDGWYFNYPEASFLAFILVVIDDRRLSSIKTKVCRLLRPTFGAREAFFRLPVQRYNNLELKTNFWATDFSVASVSIWLIALYNDIQEINCCILIELEENEGLWLRILEKRSFGHGHVRSKSFSFFFLSCLHPWSQRVCRQDLSLLRKVLKHERGNIWKARLRKSMIP